MPLFRTHDPAFGHRRWLTPSRAAGILVRIVAPVAVLWALEGALRRAHYGRPTELFIPDTVVGYYRTNPGFLAPFLPPSFGIGPPSFRIRLEKPVNTVRIFILGESAAQGAPEPAFGLAPQLKAQLAALCPGKAFEVYNLAVPATNSHVAYRISRELGAFAPDVLVIDMGHNEVVGPYGPGCAYLSSNPPLWVIRTSAWMRGTRTGQLLSQLLGRVALARLRPRDWRGRDTFSGDPIRGDDPRLEAVYRNFEGNLRDIAAEAARARARLVFATVVANVRDCSPFLSHHRDNLAPAQLASWTDAVAAGSIAMDLGDTRSASVAYGEALRIDPEYAEAHFQLARVAESAGQAAIARRHYFDALHWDAMHLRPDPRVNAIIRRVAGSAGESAVLVDAARQMGADPDSAAPLAGHGILLDHAHLNWAGNFRLAQLVAEGCARALFGAGGPQAGGLSSADCAAALGYTADGRLKMLQATVVETIRPPFAGESSFSENQAMLAKDIDAAIGALGAPNTAAADIVAVRQAHALDPDSAPLALLLARMEAESANFTGAVSLLQRVEALEPRSAELSRRKAEALIGLRRFDEAEALLLSARAAAADPAPIDRTLVELWTASRQFERGRQFFEEALAGAPADPYLRLSFARLLYSGGGDLAGAEREARRVWDADPDSRPAADALGFLIRIYTAEQRVDAADALTLEAREHQPGDYANNKRLARIYGARDEPLKAAESLLAVAASGPFTAAEHLDLAHRLADLNRGLAMLDELARAREVAKIEGKAPETETIDRLIGIYRRRLSHAPSP